MDFNKPGILEIDGERVALETLELEHRLLEPTIIKARILPIWAELNALNRRRVGLNIDRVIFNDPATIVIWSDGTKTVVKCQDGDTYSKEQGLAMCISKKYLGNKGNFNEVFKKFIGDEYTHGENKPKTVKEMRQELHYYCKGLSCDQCKVSDIIPRCGAGYHVKYNDSNHKAYIPNDEIKKAYKNVFK